jgi:hypothetical protein
MILCEHSRQKVGARSAGSLGLRSGRSRRDTQKSGGSSLCGIAGQKESKEW